MHKQQSRWLVVCSVPSHYLNECILTCWFEQTLMKLYQNPKLPFTKMYMKTLSAKGWPFGTSLSALMIWSWLDCEGLLTWLFVLLTCESCQFHHRPAAHFTDNCCQWNWNSVDRSFRCNPVFAMKIATKFCTCHDSKAVVSCAKICSSDHNIRTWMREKNNFDWILNHQRWLSVKWDHGAHNTLKYSDLQTKDSRHFSLI